MIFYDIIARYYDAENELFIEDLPFYDEIAAEYGGPIVDIGAGTGRVLIHLAQSGYQTVGIDYSEEMLAIAKRKMQVLPDLTSQIKLIQADIRDYVDQNRYPLILIPYNGFMHLGEQEDQLKVLQRIPAMLTEDGLLVIDLPNGGEIAATEDDGRLVLERTFHEPANGHLVMQQTVSAINRLEQKLYITWVYDEVTGDGTVKRTVAPQTLRYVFASEMKLLLKLAGLELIEMYGDYERSPFVDGSERMIVLARKAQ